MRRYASTTQETRRDAAMRARARARRRRYSHCAATHNGVMAWRGPNRTNNKRKLATEGRLMGLGLRTFEARGHVDVRAEVRRVYF